MNIGEANAVNVVVQALAGVRHPFTGDLPTVEQQQRAVDLLLAGAYRKLSAGLQPGQVTVGEQPSDPDRSEACCHLACNGGACETCACCCAGWCVFGVDGIPADPDDRARWLEVAAEHNPVAAALRAALDIQVCQGGDELHEDHVRYCVPLAEQLAAGTTALRSGAEDDDCIARAEQIEAEYRAGDR